MGVEFTEEHLTAIIETNAIVKEMQKTTELRRQGCQEWFKDHEQRVRKLETWRYYLVGIGAGISFLFVAVSTLWSLMR